MPAFAPGRVNLIGEHTDYNGGLALAFAIGQGVTVTAEPAPAWAVPAGAEDYVCGVAVGLGHADPARLLVESDLPIGEGLGSSAALCVAAALALGGREEPPLDLARICQRAENDFAGAQTGLLDQLTSLLGRPGEGVLLDFGGEPSWRHVALDLGDARLAVIPSGAGRELACSGYNERRAECERRHPARMRHVESENERVRAAAAALEGGDVAALGPLLDASHASLRDDFEVSVPEVERTVGDAKGAGALGARIMGGGFGGSVLALFEPDAVLPASAIEVRPSVGAHQIGA
jgi:galactokinase